MNKNIFTIIVITLLIIAPISALQASSVKTIIKAEYGKMEQGQDAAITKEQLKSLLTFYLKDDSIEYSNNDVDVYIGDSNNDPSTTQTIETIVTEGEGTTVYINGEETRSIGQILTTADSEITLDNGEYADTTPLENPPEVQTIGGGDLIWFLTATKYGVKLRDGSAFFNGLEEADAKCNQDGAKFRRQFKAIISTESVDAKNRVPQSGRVVNVLGQVLAEDVNNLFPLPNFNTLGVEANLAENAARTGSPNGGDGTWWGSDINGVKTSGNTCNGWTTSGSGKQINIQTGEMSGGNACQSLKGHLICLAQSGGTSGWCGDGIRQATYEKCDSGIINNGKPCIPEEGEVCTYCEKDCTEKTIFGSVCGDGIVEGKEECDDQNNRNDDGCNNCKWRWAGPSSQPDLMFKYLLENPYGNARAHPEDYPTHYFFGFIGKSIGTEITKPIRMKIYNEENGHIFYEREIPSPFYPDNPTKSTGGGISGAGLYPFEEGENKIILEIDSKNEINEKYEDNNKGIIICNKDNEKVSCSSNFKVGGQYMN